MNALQNLECQLGSWSLENKRVFLRADLNIALKNNSIADDYRLRAILPVIDEILKKNGTIILATHIGRPKNQEPSLSTKILMPWFEAHGYRVVHEPDANRAQDKSYKIKDGILLLENLRFFPGEKNQDPLFAQQLKKLGDYYINDAFALLHRDDTSITLLAELFTPQKRSIGPLIKQELKTLQNIRSNPAHPYLLVLGGGKVADKIPYIMNFLCHVDTILLCPALVSAFMKAEGKSVGLSMIDVDSLKLAKTILQEAKKKNVRILFPVDYLVANKAISGALSYCSADKIKDEVILINIGPETVKLFSKEIQAAKTIVFNAAAGFLDRSETIEPTKKLLGAINSSSAFSVVSGGESVAIARGYKLDYGINFLSTGGGATLAFLSGEKLPGLEPFL